MHWIRVGEVLLRRLMRGSFSVFLHEAQGFNQDWDESSAGARDGIYPAKACSLWFLRADVALACAGLACVGLEAISLR